VRCDIENSVVTGSVQVDAGSWFASGTSNIYGNLVGEPGFDYIFVDGGASGGFDVRGNVEVRDGKYSLELSYGAHILGSVEASNTDTNIIMDSVVDGHVSIIGAPGLVQLWSLRVGDYMSLLGNQSDIVFNQVQVGGNLVCFGNDGVSVGWAGLSVAGQEFGQCAGL
jgi:hypothetical protein